MKGSQAYNEQIKHKIFKLINDNQDKPYLEGFYNFILTNMSYASVFNYLFYVNKFIDELGITDVKNIKLDDYTK